MTDLFERRLAERLQAHPLPEEIPDLGIRSVRLGQRMRRRRIGAVVVALVLLLMIPAASGLWRLTAGTGDPPVSSPSSAPPQTSTPQTMATFADWVLLRKSAPCAKGRFGCRLGRP